MSKLTMTLPFPRVVQNANSPLRRALRRFRQHRLAMFGVVIIAILVVAAMIGSEADAINNNLKQMNKPPSLTHPLGTDRTGRDVLARTLVGGRVSLAVGLVSVAFSTMIGMTLGALAGYFRGWVDVLIMRVVDVVMSSLWWWHSLARVSSSSW
jgi:peptide/nickel transport system permease protein